jgi:hypothetical protein
VISVPAFELAGIAGLAYQPRQPIPEVWRSAAKEAAPEVVAGSLRPQRVAGHVPCLSAIFHFNEPFFTIVTALIIQDFKDLHHVSLLPPVLEGRQAQLIQPLIVGAASEAGDRLDGPLLHFF